MVGGFQLFVQQGPQAGQAFALNKSILAIGREAGNDIVLESPQISRYHAADIAGWRVRRRRHGQYEWHIPQWSAGTEAHPRYHGRLDRCVGLIPPGILTP